MKTLTLKEVQQVSGGCIAELTIGALGLVAGKQGFGVANVLVCDVAVSAAVGTAVGVIGGGAISGLAACSGPLSAALLGGGLLGGIGGITVGALTMMYITPFSLIGYGLGYCLFNNGPVAQTA